MSVTVQEIMDLMESIAPKSYAMEWDHVGLQIGSPKKEVQRIMITLEINLKVVEEAVAKSVDLIISHHPLIFNPLSKIDFEDPKGATIQKIIQEDLHIYVSHTNMDVAPRGLNHHIAEKIGLKNISVLDAYELKPYYKFIVYVPKTHSPLMIDAIHKGGGGYIGNYSHCTYKISGTGTFKPEEGSNPFLGEKNELEKVEEDKVETIVEQKDIQRLIHEVQKAHPYEEVAYDLYPLEKSMDHVGLGRIGELTKTENLEAFIGELKASLQLSQVRYVGNLKQEISKVGILNGSGGDFATKAQKAGVDCFITGDLKYHDAQDAMEGEMAVVDIGHYESEIIFREFIKAYLKTSLGDQVEYYLANTLENPLKTF